MGRKRRLGLTSLARFRLKAFRVAAAGVPEELAMDYAMALGDAWQQGFSPYHNMHKLVQEQFFQPRGIPAALRGLYLAFCNEYLARVVRRGIETVDYLIEKWTRLGLDRDVLRELVDFLCRGAGSRRAGR
mgnify:CR=1 FL=1